ncbi:vWA domain-containing protein [Halomonas sp. LS-001]
MPDILRQRPNSLQAGGPRGPDAQENRLKKRMQQVCEADRAWLLTSQPFTAKLLMQLQLIAVVDSRLPTAGTDGESIFFNAAFMAGRSEADRRFILAHEVWHCALGHHRRQFQRDARRWNNACDYEVNALLKEALGHCPRDALFKRSFQGQSAEQIYAQLSQQEPLRGQTLDVHDLQGALHELPTSVHDPDFAPRPVSAENARGWEQRLVATAQQIERQQGNLPGHVARLIERLRQPVIPWQQVLAQFIHATLRGNRQWLPPSRRHVYRGLYLPSQRSQSLSLAVVIDTSGSCQRDLPHFLSELRGILGSCDRVSLEVIEFDTRITQRRCLDEGQLHELAQWRSRGGGGSDIRPVFEALTRTPPELMVVLTDGFISAPTQAAPYPVIWCLTEHGRAPVKWGSALRLSA